MKILLFIQVTIALAATITHNDIILNIALVLMIIPLINLHQNDGTKPKSRVVKYQNYSKDFNSYFKKYNG